MIEVCHLNKTFSSQKSRNWFFRSKKSVERVCVIKDLSFQIKEGEFVAFLGPNGAGKTTTLKILTGILTPTSGEVSVFGFVPTERKEKFLKSISFVMAQKTQLFMELPVKSTLEFIGEIYDIPEKIYKAKIEELARVFNVENLLNRSARKLSLGQRMKCELIASLIYNPKVIFLDEPTVGLDINSAFEVREFLKELNKKFKTTIILTTHNMADVEEMCERTILINHGEKVFDGKTEDLKNLYGQKRTIEFIVEHLPKFDQKMITKWGIIDQNENSFKINIDKKETSKITSEILTQHDVKEMNFIEEDLSKIIAKIYRDENI